MNARTAAKLIHFGDPLPYAQTDSPAPERCLGEPVERTTWERYASADGALSMGEWSCGPGAWRIRFHAGRHEFFHVLEGRIRIAGNADGQMREFGPGDAAVIPAGFSGVFEVLETVRKYYVMIDALPSS